MANKDVFSIEWEGLDELNKHLTDMSKNVETIMIEEMTKFSMLAEEATKALVQHDEGDLEDSINFDKAKKEGKNIVATGGSNKEYALRRHEEPYRMGVHDKYPGDNYYVGGRGRRTLRKPNWRGIRPGRKYMENAVKSIENDFDKTLVRALERILDA